ncbi:hypothetical protein LSAT2_008202 [Lamellibrachia satsuma]|nr:hypothetical protein LSAT2_008202 [Lamellibrachia satsuma]
MAALTPHVAALTPHVAALTPHVAALTPHVAALTQHVAALTPHVAALTPHVAELTPHEAALTPHVAAMRRRRLSDKARQDVLRSSTVRFYPTSPDLVGIRSTLADNCRLFVRRRKIGKSHQNSSTVENEANNVTYNSARDAVTIGGRENGYTVPHSMSTLETMLSVNTERFWDVGPFKPPELVDTDTRSMTTSELNRAVRAINAEDAEQQQHRANSSGCMSDFRPLVAVFSRIDESEETCSISGTSI